MLIETLALCFFTTKIVYSLHKMVLISLTMIQSIYVEVAQPHANYWRAEELATIAELLLDVSTNLAHR